VRVSTGWWPQDITATVRGRDAKAARRDAQTGELLRVLGLAERLNKPIPPAQEREG
jgi:hypothetical protein